MDHLGWAKEAGYRLAEARPFLKWAGSKHKLLAQLRPVLPNHFRRYFEPFLGSGAVFFELKPREASLSDLCVPLIDTYKAVRDQPQKVTKLLDRQVVNSERYYEVRASHPRSSAARASRFIYLNKTCWNGLYRENLKGEFNVPFGAPKTVSLYDRSSFMAASALLARDTIKLAQGDFEATLDGAGRGDFVFLDPPYVTTHNSNGFIEYNGKIFSWSDQERLAEIAHRLKRKGAIVIVTNADHPSVAALYANFQKVTIGRHSTLASKVDRRVRVTEAIFL